MAKIRKDRRVANMTLTKILWIDSYTNSSTPELSELETEGFDLAFSMPCDLTDGQILSAQAIVISLEQDTALLTSIQQQQAFLKSNAPVIVRVDRANFELGILATHTPNAPQPSLEYNVTKYYTSCNGTNPLDGPFNEALNGVGAATTNIEQLQVRHLSLATPPVECAHTITYSRMRACNDVLILTNTLTHARGAV